jgi:hypothetical protein
LPGTVARAATPADKTQITGTVSNLHMYLQAELNGQPGLLEGFHHAKTQIFARSPCPRQGECESLHSASQA